jgi:hypothetical protein
MNIVFRLELDKGPKSPHDPAVLEISSCTSGIHFAVIDGANRPILAGHCEPEELSRLALMLAGDE